MITRMLTSDDEYLHQPTTDPTWNESRYVDFYDSATKVGGWLRMGMRPNQQHCEASACLYLPDGRVTFSYQRSSIENNGTEAGGQIWNVGDPYRRLTASFAGPMIAMADPWQLLQPKTAFATNPRVHAEIDLQLRSEGLPAVMGSDQAHIDTIFLPGQADWHFQQLCWTSGTIQVDGQRFDVTGRGGRDRSWGPRNWLAKIYLRWFTASTDDDEFGFMLLRAVGPTKSTRGGHVWDGGEFFLVDDFEMRNTFSERSPHELSSTEVQIRSGRRRWSATGTARNWIPLRHVGPDQDGVPCTLRIVKSPMTWTFGDGRAGSGGAEIHDRLDDRGDPVGLHD